MRGTALGHRLETLNDGLTTFSNGERAPLPLIATDIQVQILAGVAQVTTSRHFRNAEAVPIEAIMTFPVGFDAVLTGLTATIDGRRMVGVAQEKSEARETYETALDEGRLSVLHEEALRGIHILSVGALPPGAEVSVELEQVVPMTEVSGKQFLRLPMTAGQLYGNSPMLPADDMVTSNALRHDASLHVVSEEGNVFREGRALARNEKVSILLNRAVELVIEGGTFGMLQGRAADGRAVSISFQPTHGHDAALDLHVLVDRSGSTQDFVGDGEVSIWQAMRDGLGDAFRTMRPSDRMSLWQFDSACQFLGAARGEACSKLVGKLQGPAGGTELSGALRAAIAAGAKDLLVLTDGQTWAHIVDDLKRETARISAILVGPGSLDANVGHLCAMTGGQVFYAPGKNVSSPLQSAFEALRTPGASIVGQAGEAGPEQVTVLRGGITIKANWSADISIAKADKADAVGRFAAALAVPLLDVEVAESWARSHSLCTHATSLVLVDDAGEAAQGFSHMRKVPMMRATCASVSSKRPSPVLSRMRASVPVSYEMPHQASSRYTPMGRPSAEALDRLRSAIQTQSKESPPQAYAYPSPEKGMIARLLSRLRGPDPHPDYETFAEFGWDQYGDALLAGDLSSLNGNQWAEVNRLARKISEHERRLSGPVDVPTDKKILALGLIARKLDTRISKRFASKALKNVPPWVLEKLP